MATQNARRSLVDGGWHLYRRRSCRADLHALPGAGALESGPSFCLDALALQGVLLKLNKSASLSAFWRVCHMVLAKIPCGQGVPARCRPRQRTLQGRKRAFLIGCRRPWE
jgi:hypothetical protein